MKKLLIHLERRHPKNKEIRNSSLEELLSDHTLKFICPENTPKSDPIKKVRYAQQWYFQRLARLLQFVEYLEEDNVISKEFFFSVKKKGNPLQDYWNSTVQSINNLQQTLSPGEFSIVKDLNSYWRVIEQCVENMDYYVVGTELYKIHRRLLEKSKDSKRFNAKSLKQKMNELEITSLYSTCIMRNLEFSQDLIQEQRRFLNREYDITRSKKMNDQYNPAVDFLILEAELLFRFASAAKDKSSQDLAKKRGYEPHSIRRKSKTSRGRNYSSRKYNSRY